MSTVIMEPNWREEGHSQTHFNSPISHAFFHVGMPLYGVLGQNLFCLSFVYGHFNKLNITWEFSTLPIGTSITTITPFE